MSKFNRITECKFVRIAQTGIFQQQPAQAPSNQLVGNPPQDLTAFMNKNTAPVQGPVKPAIQAPVAPVKNVPTSRVVNYFAKAGIIDPKQYTGTADQNEKLRQVIDPSARNFYEAYVNKFGKWAQHPGERIDKLSGGATGVKPISSTPSAPATNSQFLPSAAAPSVPNTGTPPSATPPGFTRAKSGLLLPPLPR